MEGKPIPYPFLVDLMKKADVSKGLTPSVINYRLSPYADELIHWVYPVWPKRAESMASGPICYFCRSPNTNSAGPSV